MDVKVLGFTLGNVYGIKLDIVDSTEMGPSIESSELSGTGVIQGIYICTNINNVIYKIYICKFP